MRYTRDCLLCAYNQQSGRSVLPRDTNCQNPSVLRLLTYPGRAIQYHPRVITDMHSPSHMSHCRLLGVPLQLHIFHSRFHHVHDPIKFTLRCSENLEVINIQLIYGRSIRKLRRFLLRTGEGTLWLQCDIYLPREKGNRGLRSVKMEYKATKIKGAVKLHCNEDPAIQTCGTLKSRVSKWDRGLRLKTPLGSRGSLVSNLISSISVRSRRNCEIVKQRGQKKKLEISDGNEVSLQLRYRTRK